MYTEERQQRIYSLLKEKKSISVNALSENFGVSKATIRTDLSALEREGLVIRTHGGAILPDHNTIPASTVRDGSDDDINREIDHGRIQDSNHINRKAKEDALTERAFKEEKEKIAKAAAALVEDGDFLLIDSGTTAQAFARQLALSPRRDLTVYSNDLAVIAALEENPSISTNVLPGRIRSGFHYAYGDDTIAALQDAHFTRLFLTTSALDLENGLTVVKPHLSSLKKAMLRAGNTVILITDSTKIGETRFQKFADLSEIDILITDSGAKQDDIASLRSIVGQLIICD